MQRAFKRWSTLPFLIRSILVRSVTGSSVSLSHIESISESSSAVANVVSTGLTHAKTPCASDWIMSEARLWLYPIRSFDPQLRSASRWLWRERDRWIFQSVYTQWKLTPPVALHKVAVDERFLDSRRCIASSKILSMRMLCRRQLLQCRSWQFLWKYFPRTVQPSFWLLRVVISIWSIFCFRAVF